MQHAQTRFDALTTSQMAALESAHDRRVREYRRRLERWHSDQTPEESIALLRFEVDAKKREKIRVQKRLRNKVKKAEREKRGVRVKEEGEPVKPGSPFLSENVMTKIVKHELF